MKQILTLIFVAFFYMLGVGVARAQTPTPSPTPTTNDPQCKPDWEAQVNIAPWRSKESSATRVVDQVVIVIADFQMQSHPDLDPNMLPDHNTVLTEDGTVAAGMHGNAVASAADSVTNNGIGPCSIAGTSGRIKMINATVFGIDPQTGQPLATPRGIENVLQFSLDKIAQGVPIRVINFSLGGGPADATSFLALLKKLDEKNVTVVFAGGLGGRDVDDEPAAATFPGLVRLGARNVIAVSATTDTDQLDPTSNRGKKTMAIAAPAKMSVVSFGDPINGGGTIVGTSASAAQVSGLMAMIYLYKETDGQKARERLYFTAKRTPDLVSGVTWGAIDVDRALTARIGCPLPSDTPELLGDMGRLTAVDQVMQTAEPFSLTSRYFNQSGPTTVAAFAFQVALLPGEALSSVIVMLRDSAGRSYEVPASFVGKPGNPECLVQIGFSLPAELATGDTEVRVKKNGFTSGKFLMAVRR